MNGANSSYKPNVIRYVSQKDTTGQPTELFTSIATAGTGTVVYLAGHDYSGHDLSGGASIKPGMTAGTRLVLNTLFSLGTTHTCGP